MKKVLLILAEGFEILEASVFIDVIGWNYLEGDHSTKLVSCGFTREVSSAFGQEVVVDHLIGEIDVDEFEALAIPGGFGEFGFHKSAYQEQFLDVIRRFDEAGKLIASICTGALPIGKSGVLSGRCGTTYNLNTTHQKTLADCGVLIQQRPIVVDRNIITSWNPSTSLDVAFTLLLKLTSHDNMVEVQRLMGFQQKTEKHEIHERG